MCASCFLAGQFSIEWAMVDDEEGIMLITDQPEDNIVELPTTTDDIKPYNEAQKSSYYAQWMWYLKSREGYIYKEYLCPAGKRTVGYGHNIDAHGYKYCGKYLSHGKISYKAATELLKDDAERQCNWLLKEMPYLTKNQALAVTSLLLNCGSAKIQYTHGNRSLGESTFWKRLRNKQTPNFLVYCKYKTPSGNVVKSPNLVNARKFEQALFEKDYETVKSLGEHYRQIVASRDIGDARKRGLLN
jgi:GH24 family phage-related lysozyme (muramidase)